MEPVDPVPKWKRRLDRFTRIDPQVRAMYPVVLVLWVVAIIWTVVRHLV